MFLQPGVKVETGISAQAVDRLAHFPHGLLHPHKKGAGYDRMAYVQLMQVRHAVHQLFQILVVDAMTGQDAVNVSGTFNDKIGIDGVILTKLDGDTRGGAALSIRSVTGKPILYIGMGEKLSDLEQFYPDRMASRIL